jgi:hypothetical protein
MWPLIGALLRWRGTRIVRCPETRRPVAVEVDATHAALSAIFREPDLRLRSCTRWPERRDCGQECLSQVERAPEDCLVRNLVAEWFRGRRCAYCRTPFGEIHWHDHRPALRSPQGVTVKWDEVGPETLPALFETHLPVCWNCHVAESFRRQHPDLVVDRPPHLGGGTGAA